MSLCLNFLWILLYVFVSHPPCCELVVPTLAGTGRDTYEKSILRVISEVLKKLTLPAKNSAPEAVLQQIGLSVLRCLFRIGVDYTRECVICK